MADLTDLEMRKICVKKQGAFANLNDAEVDVLATLLKEVTFQPGEMIVKEGAHVDSVFIIVKGMADVVRSQKVDGEIKTEKLATLTDGAAIGLNDRGFYSLTGLRTATVIANTELVTLKLSVPIFRGFALAYPHASEVMRQQAERL